MRDWKFLWRIVAVLLAFGLVAAACGDDDDAVDEPAAASTEETPSTGEPDEDPDEAPDEMMEHLGDGSLGVVTVEAGDAIQIRSLEAITGDVAFFGLPIDR
ncbi:MAG: hypothetical protein OXC00_09650, partial [Acidimicrobiaceae bacterium]|nr:hypothetical protein [Acidimicrobiaceae bacterium]